jgi:DNA repair exonuclease SbcCD ATPase subunit
MARDISKFDKTLDSRDVIARIDELQGELDDAEETIADLELTIGNTEDELAALPRESEEWQSLNEKLGGYQDDLTIEVRALNEWKADYGDELKELKDLASECEGYGDWIHGDTLINDDFFEEYAEELADDLGYLGSRREPLKWPFTCIDWEQAAKELQQDYSSVSFGGQTFWVRQ